jgi:pimeloyl-ACP methyl ester carboxylesterase
MESPGTVYALLVGINAYPNPVPQLQGCINDIERVTSFLIERVADEGHDLQLLQLYNEQATRQQVIVAFEQHLAQAGEGDVALFYFSGHGSQAVSPPEFWRLEPDHLDETLICYDSRLPGGWDLADKELAYLIDRLAERNPHILIVLDACHSGSGTRNLEDTSIRRVSTDNRARPFETFYVAQDMTAAIRRTTASGWFDLPLGRHVVLSACRADEEAREMILDGERRGVFSYYLLETLQQLGPSLSYWDLFNRVDVRVRSIVGKQSPQIEAVKNTDLGLAFLGGAIGPGRPSFTVHYEPSLGWIMDGGAVHGIAPPRGDEHTVMALFPFEANAVSSGTALVKQVMPTQSQVELTLTTESSLSTDQVYKAHPIAVPIPPIPVRFEGDEAAIELVRVALNRSNLHNEPSQLICEADTGDETSLLHLTATAQGYQIRRTGEILPLSVNVSEVNETGARQAVEHLEHIARWLNVVQLANQASRLPHDAVRLEIYSVDPATGLESERPLSNSELAMTYREVAGNLVCPQFKIKLINTTNQVLYCILLDLPETYSISAGLLDAGRIKLGPRGTSASEAWALRNKPIQFYIPAELHQQGVHTLRDVLKLIVSTSDGDGRLLEQGDLGVRYTTSNTRSVDTRTTISRLMRRISIRHLGQAPEAHDILGDWRTSEIMLTVSLPSEGVVLPHDNTQEVEIAPGVYIAGHPGLHCKARVASVEEASRDVGNLALPPLLRDDAESLFPFVLTTNRSAEAAGSVVELLSIEDAGLPYQAVTSAQPLVVRTQTALAPNEAVLPLAFDGEFFLPLGTFKRHTGGGTEFHLERLPHPTSEGNRSLGGAIKIYFRKVLTDWLTIQNPYPRLALASVKNKEVSYCDNTETIQDAVAAAKRIVLFLHGIIGDTSEMALYASELPSHVNHSQSELLVLTFDYESLSTKIERTAQDLKQKLREVGLGANHGKTLHIVAHSMGGLVARWFIEKEGGNQVVQRLIMLGTPNGGSPWPTIQDWATATIGIGINFISSIAWPVKALGWLIAAIEKIDEPLDQMKSDSDLLRGLYLSDEPGVPYIILTGNTSIINTLQQQAGDAGINAVRRLLERITPQHLLHGTTALAFLGKPNDIAVSVESMVALPSDFLPQTVVHEIACDHLTYFTSQIALSILEEVILTSKVTKSKG